MAKLCYAVVFLFSKAFFFSTIFADGTYYVYFDCTYIISGVMKLGFADFWPSFRPNLARPMCRHYIILYFQIIGETIPWVISCLFHERLTAFTRLLGSSQSHFCTRE